jgi:uncharacterized membrane protein
MTISQELEPSFVKNDINTYFNNSIINRNIPLHALIPLFLAPRILLHFDHFYILLFLCLISFSLLSRFIHSICNIWVLIPRDYLKIILLQYYVQEFCSQCLTLGQSEQKTHSYEAI